MILKKACKHTHANDINTLTWSSLGKQNVQVQEVCLRNQVMPGVRGQEGTASKDLCHNEFEFFLFLISIVSNRKLENEKHFLDMPAVNKSWSRRAVFTVICE